MRYVIRLVSKPYVIKSIALGCLFGFFAGRLLYRICYLLSSM